MKISLFFEALERLLNETIEFETTTGTLRSGVVTGFTHFRIMFGPSKVDLVKEIELNGDPSDRVPLEEIKRMEKV